MKALRLDTLGTAFILVWSSGYLVGSIATRSMPPLAVTMWRFAIAAVLLAVVAVVRRERWPHGRHTLALLGVGVPMFAVQFGALYTAMSDGLTAGTTSLIACSSPLAVAAIGAASGWERLRPMQWLGIGLGVLGVTVTLADRVGRPPNLASLLWALTGLAGLAIGTTLQSRLDTRRRTRRHRVRGGRRRLRGAGRLGAARGGRCSPSAVRIRAGVVRLARRGHGCGSPVAPVRAGPQPRGDRRQQPPVRRPGRHRGGRVAPAGHPARPLDRGGPGDRGGGADAGHGPAGREPCGVSPAGRAAPEGSPAGSWSGRPRSCCGPPRPVSRAARAARPRPPERASAPPGRPGS